MAFADEYPPDLAIHQPKVFTQREFDSAVAAARHENWEVPPNRGGVHHGNCACYDDEQPSCEPDECPFCACWRIKAAVAAARAERAAIIAAIKGDQR